MTQIRLFLFLCSLTFDLCSWAQTDYQKAKERSIELYQSGRYQEALLAIDPLLQSRSDYELYIIKSYCAEQLGLEKDAIQSITNALRIADEDVALFFRRGTLAYRQGWFQMCIDDLSRYINEPPTTTTGIIFQIDEQGGEQLKIKTSNSLLAEAYSMRGLAFQKMGNQFEAESDLNHAVEINPTPAYLVNRALLKIEKNEHDMAKDDLRKAIDLDSMFANAWYNLLIIDPDLEVPETVFANDQFYPMVKYRMIEAIRTSDYELANQLISPLLNQRKDATEILVFAGRISYGLKQFDQALGYYMQANAKDHELDQINALIANTYFQMNQFEAAVSHYELHLVANYQDAGVWFNAAVAYHRLGDITNMCRCLTHADRLQVDDQQLARMLSLCD